jgi:diphosphomevalonate decarboxylase
MISKHHVVQKILKNHNNLNYFSTASAFAPANIALCKYWGKRDAELNLPYHSSFSLSLGKLGVQTTISFAQEDHDIIISNNQMIAQETEFAQRIIEFLNLIRPNKHTYFQIQSTANIPIAAGLASSAAGFAALVKACNRLFNWRLDKQELSILARLGSGSACRSLWHGFVEWHAGLAHDGMDSYGEPFTVQWPELRIAILIVSSQPKNISSRQAMKLASDSPFYHCWLTKVETDLTAIKRNILNQEFLLFGRTVEENALAMHALIQTSWPPIQYTLPATLAAIQKIWQAREQGLALFFTQDAGANLQLLFLQQDTLQVQALFPTAQIIAPFLNVP